MIARAKLMLLILSAGWLASSPGPVASQTDTSGLSINPAITEKVVASGQLTIIPLTVTNVSESPRAINISFRGLAPIDDIIDESARNRYDASGWLNVDQTRLLISAGESQTINVRVSPPADAGPGGHYATVVFRVLSSTALEQSTTNAYISPEIASVLFLTVPGDVRELVQADFASPPWYSRSSSPKFTAALSNLGTVHVLPTVSVVLRQLSGVQQAELTMPPKLLIPGTRATLAAEWADAPAGVYRAEYTLSYGSPIQQITHSSPLIFILPALWIQIVAMLSLGLLVRGVVPPLFRRLRRRRVRLARDLTGEPNLKIDRQSIERSEKTRKLEDISRRK